MCCFLKYRSVFNLYVLYFGVPTSVQDICVVFQSTDKCCKISFFSVFRSVCFGLYICVVCSEYRSVFKEYQNDGHEVEYRHLESMLNHLGIEPSELEMEEIYEELDVYCNSIQFNSLLLYLRPPAHIQNVIQNTYTYVGRHTHA